MVDRLHHDWGIYARERLHGKIGNQRTRRNQDCLLLTTYSQKTNWGFRTTWFLPRSVSQYLPLGLLFKDPTNAQHHYTEDQAPNTGALAVQTISKPQQDWYSNFQGQEGCITKNVVRTSLERHTGVWENVARIFSYYRCLPGNRTTAFSSSWLSVVSRRNWLIPFPFYLHPTGWQLLIIMYPLNLQTYSVNWRMVVASQTHFCGLQGILSPVLR